MYQTNTFAMYHPEHGECVADETAEPSLLALGWKRESADDPNAGGSGSEGGEGEGGESNVPAGGAPAAQGAKAGAKAGSKSPAAQGAKA